MESELSPKATDESPAAPIVDGGVASKQPSPTEKPSERLRTLFHKAASHYAESPEGIARLVDFMIAEAKKAGQALTAEEALEGSLRWAMPGYFFRPKKSEFKEYSALYLTMRLQPDKKLSHDEAIRMLHALASAVHFKSKEPSDDVFGAAFEKASPGCQLAMVESHDLVRENDPIVEYYQSLVDHVANLYSVKAFQVSISTCYVLVQSHTAFENVPRADWPKDVGAKPLDVLEAAMRWSTLLEQMQKGGPPPRLADFLGLYLSLRVKGRKSHDEAVATLCDPPGRVP